MSYLADVIRTSIKIPEYKISKKKEKKRKENPSNVSNGDEQTDRQIEANARFQQRSVNAPLRVPLT